MMLAFADLRLLGEKTMWSQIYDPFNNTWLSTLAAAIPVVVMLAALAFFHIKAHIAAAMGLVAALVNLGLAWQLGAAWPPLSLTA